MEKKGKRSDSQVINDFIGILKNYSERERARLVTMVLYTLTPEGLQYTSDLSKELLQKRDFIFGLPEDLSIKILQLLNDEEMGWSACVSSYWNEICADAMIWRNLTYKYYPFHVNIAIGGNWKENYKKIREYGSVYISGFLPTMREIEGGGTGFAMVPSLSDEIITNASAGYQHIICVNRKGEVFSWGKGANGRLGHGDIFDRPHPEKISYLQKQKITTVSCGRDHSVCISSAGDVYAFGENSRHQSGFGQSKDVQIPRKVEGLPAVKSCSAGWTTTLFLSKGGLVFVAGSSSLGNLGIGHGGEHQVARTPQHIEILNRLTTGICHISAGDQHSCAVSNDGWLFTWGNGASGRLGHGNTLSLHDPLRVDALLGKMIVAASAGGGHTVALDNKGNVYVMGEGSAGQLGDGAYGNEFKPKLVESLRGVKILNVSAGSGHTCCVSTGVNIFSCGCGWNCRLGYPTAQNTCTMRLTRIPPLDAQD